MVLSCCWCCTSSTTACSRGHSSSNTRLCDACHWHSCGAASSCRGPYW
jgi:hypothetical protein